MSFTDRMLQPPSYGYRRGGELYVPSQGELWREFFSHLNVFRSRKNWLTLFGWFATASLIIPLVLFALYHFSWQLVALGFVYSMIVLGSHGTVWLHRYATHRGFTFRNRFWRALCRNLVIKIVPEEIYVISHHVHHRLTEQPGDPYNVHGGFLYCFLADANHQGINQELGEADYARLVALIEHTGVRTNSYAQYQRWGSLCHPAFTAAHYALNWLFWYGAFYLLGGHALALALFGSAAVWGFGVRTFNFEGHGAGKDKRQSGIDFNTQDLSINQLWPGFVAGEWHNNHHLAPGGARSGFLPYQLDLPWYFIWSCWRVGIVSTYRDDKAEFLRRHYQPYRASLLPEVALHSAPDKAA